MAKKLIYRISTESTEKLLPDLPKFAPTRLATLTVGDIVRRIELIDNISNMLDVNMKKNTYFVQDIIPFLDLFLSEDQLNSVIEQTNDVDVLNLAIDIKLGYISSGRHEKIELSFDKWLGRLNADNCDKICNVLKMTPLIASDHSLLTYPLDYIKTCKFDSENEILIAVKLLHVALDVSQGLKLKDISKFIDSEYIIELYLQILKNARKYIHNIFVLVLEKYLNVACAEAISRVWNVILENRDACTLSCLIHNFVTFDVLSKRHNFWSFLQDSLLNGDTHMQKMTMHILKTSINHIISNKLSLSSQLEIVSNCIVSPIEFKAAWQNFFILLDVLKEKQLHLITPSFCLLRTVDNLHPLWLLCLYKSMLGHTQSSVVCYAAVDLFSACWYDDLFFQIVRYILVGLNKIEVSDCFLSTCDEFEKFVRKLSNEKFVVLLNESLPLTRSPSAAWLFYSIIFSVDYVIPSSYIDYAMTQIINLPHKFIRNNCLDLLFKLVGKRTTLLRIGFCDATKFAIRFIDYDEKFSKISKLYGDIYKYEILHEMLTWQYADDINVNRISLFMNIIKGDELIVNCIMSMIKKKNFDQTVRDKIFLQLCTSAATDFDIVNYLDVRCDEITVYNAELNQIVNSIKSDITRTDLYKKCTNILLNPGGFNTSKICLSYTIFNLNPIDDETIASILRIWKHKFLNSQETNANICKSFIRLHSRQTLQNEITSEFLEETRTLFELFFDTQNQDVILDIFMYLKYFLVADDRNQRFLKRCLKEVTEIKNVEVFTVGWNHFAHYIINNAYIIEDDEFALYLMDRLTEFLNKSEVGAFIFSDHLKKVSKGKNIDILIPLIVKLSLYENEGPTTKRVEYEICKKIAQKMQLMNEDLPASQEISIRLSSLITLRNIVEGKRHIGDEIASILLDKYMKNFNRRYFPNSRVHLQKLRIMQTFLVLHDHIGLEKKQTLTDLLIRSFCEESHQPCVKQLMQWLLIKLLQNVDGCLEIVSVTLNESSRTHPSTIVAFIPVLYHIALKKDADFADKVIDMLLMWTMGAHFKLRVYSQYAILKLTENKNYNKTINKYEGLRNTITTVIKSSEEQCKLVLKNDLPFFEDFDTDKHYTFETIFVDIPRLNNVTSTEWECIDLNAAPNYSDLPVKNLNSPFKVPEDGAREKTITDSYTGEAGDIIQMKINPWTEIIKRETKSDSLSDLIIVTTLIDSSANLGGLCRTCEIYGVKQMVLNNRKVVNDKEFKSLSMSSENWVNVIEVKVTDLKTYLMRMKEEEYMVIGAEQTSESITLNSYKFPKRCVLLLGNERTGVPPVLLPVLDACIEIPQFGVVRSLNVHVAGAIFIWEYVKQHVI